MPIRNSANQFPNFVISTEMKQRSKLNRNISIQRTGQQRSWRLRFALLLGIAGLYLCGLSSHSAIAHASAIPGGNIADPVVRAVDIDEPAVVRIITTLHGHLTVRFPDGHSASFPQQGDGYKLNYFGSGAFITAHGDILTAEHLVKVEHDQAMDQYLEMLAAQDIATYINHTFSPNPPYTQDDVNGAFADGLFSANTTYSQPTMETYFNTDYTGPLTATALSAMPPVTHAAVDKIEQESPVALKDTAIIHVNLNDTPSISLGDSSTVEPQDELTIIGFPGNADISQKDDPTPMSFFTPSINKLFVSAVKQTDEGAPVIQVGGNVENGDSGGPALDSNGNLVGIVSFGLSDTGGATNFLQASQSAQEEVQKLRLDTAPGAFTKAWRQSFTDYAATSPGHWHKALTEFQQLTKNYPNFQGVTRYLKFAQKEATTEALSASMTDNRLLITFALALLASGILAALFFLLHNLRQQPQFATQASSTIAKTPFPATYSRPITYTPSSSFTSSTPPLPSDSFTTAAPHLPSETLRAADAPPLQYQSPPSSIGESIKHPQSEQNGHTLLDDA